VILGSGAQPAPADAAGRPHRRDPEPPRDAAPRSPGHHAQAVRQQPRASRRCRRPGRVLPDLLPHPERCRLPAAG